MGACTCQQCGKFTQHDICARCALREFINDYASELKDFTTMGSNEVPATAVAIVLEDDNVSIIHRQQ